MAIQAIHALVRVYEDGATQTQWFVNKLDKLTVMFEKDDEGDWGLSLWKSGSQFEKTSIDKNYYFKFKEEYELLVSACIKAAALSQGDTYFKHKLGMRSNDPWMLFNFMQEWQKSVDNYEIGVTLVGANDDFGVTQIKGRTRYIVDIEPL